MAPADDQAAALARLYRDVLAVDAAGPDESFFALGGSSLLVAVLLERVHEELGVRVGLRAFFDDPTLAGLERAVRAARRVPLAELLRAAAPDERPAVVAPDGTATYGELAAGLDDEPGGPLALRPASTLAGARALLARVAAHHPTVVLPPQATAAEEARAVEAFARELEATGAEGVYAVATSGSTGRAKVVVVDYERMLALRPVQAAAFGVSAGDVVLVTPPLHWGWGLQSGLLGSLLAGATVLLPPAPLTPAALGALVREHRPTVALGASFAYRLLLAADAPLDSLRRPITGGDPLPPDLADAWLERTGVPLVESYGASETDHVTVDDEGVPGSVGRPLEGVELRVVPEGGGPPAPAGVGELAVRTPALARGYAGDPEQTAARFRDGWFHTGDLAELRPDGHVLLRGRLDDQLNVGGVKVDPREVEAACRRALALADCAVLGRPLPGGATEICAYVVADRPVSRADLARALAGRLGAHKLPTRVVQLPAIPRGPAGKVLREELPR